MQILKTKKNFKQEFKRQIRLAITAAIGFTIAYSWREAVFNTFENFIARFFDLTLGHYATQVYTALVITLLGVGLIFLTSKLLKD